MFTDVLAGLSSEQLASSGDAASPSNQQILQAAKSAYGTFAHQIDALASATASFAADPAHADALAALAAYPWSGGRPSSEPIAPVVTDPAVSAALAAAAPALPCALVGVATLDASHLGLAQTGMWVPSAPPHSPAAVVTTHESLVATLSVDPATLAVGLCTDTAPPASEQDGYGLVLPAPGAARAVLVVVLTADLQPHGFVYAVGVAAGSAAVARTSLGTVSSSGASDAGSDKESCA